jgi:hypothetical protein
MPYFILTGTEKLVLLNMDFTRAALICDRDVVSVYRDGFEALLNQTTPLLTRYSSLFEYSKLLPDYRETFFSFSHWIEPAPCVTPFIDDETVGNHISREIPQRELLVESFTRHLAFLRVNLKDNKNICTVEGLRDFIQKKIPYNVPMMGVTALEDDVVERLLHEYVKEIENGNLTLLFADQSKFTLPGKTGLFISPSDGIQFMIFSDTRFGHSIRISESSINEAFFDFADTLAESGLVYGAEESLKMMKDIVDGL